MHSFLHSVASSLLALYGSDMSHLTVVFPNKRASLFLNRELAAVSSTPLLAPQYMTVSELFQDLALTAEGERLVAIDPIEAVCRLYDVYQQLMPREVEPLDKFYGWGEVMLADFNDIDKQQVDAHALFRYVEDWETLRDTSFLNEEQRAALEHYFSSFKETHQAKENFLELWKAMPAIYDAFKQSLLADGLLYDGALWRYVVENELYGDEERHYAFVGFNILPPVQKALLRGIKGRVGVEHIHFYWDYDPALAKAQGIGALFFDACQYIREYQPLFPNELEAGWSLTDHLPEVTFIKCDTANAQAHYVPAWLQSKDVRTSAVVLADEALMPQVLTTMPAVDLNITMGYPLNNTPIPGLIRALIDLQANGRRRYYKDKVLNHPLYRYLAGWQWDKAVEPTASAMLGYLMESIEVILSQMPVQLLNAQPSTPNPQLQQPSTLLYEEALFRCHEAIGHIDQQGIEDCALACRLLDKVLRTVSVPFHGEPLMGLQVMGVLETRSLDFDDVLLLNAQDGILPRAANVSSLIPYCLREPFGLSTEKEQVNVYAYNFFRLLRRARTVTLMFPTAGSRMSQGEMSRFMRQLLAETDLPIRDCRLDFRFTPGYTPSLEYAPVQEKTPERMQKLFALGEGDRALSPSAINCYLNCPMQFFYKYMEELYVEEEVTTSLAENQFGTVFHAAAEIHYREHCGVDEAVDKAFQQEIFDKSEVKTYEGELIIARNVIRDYLQRLLTMDAQLGPFRIVETEQRHTFSLDVRGHRLCIGGTIDRLDFVEHHPLTGRPALRVVDYKTGGRTENKELPSSDLSRLMDKDAPTRKSNLFQTYLYSLAVQSDVDIQPALIYIAKASNAKDYDARTIIAGQPINRFQDIAPDFRATLVDFLEQELFNPAMPFVRTSVDKHCDYCDYRLLCGLMK